jgi:hypothetical protein
MLCELEQRGLEDAPRALDLAPWLGRARFREHQLEAMAEREDLDPGQRAKVASLLGRLRAEIQGRLARANGGPGVNRP